MMIEPPRQALIGAVLKIDDGILVTVKLIAVKGVSRPVHRRCVGDKGVRMHLGTIKFGKYRGGRNTVEAVAVIKYPQFHIIPICRRAKHFRLEDGTASRQGNDYEYQDRAS